MDIKRPDMEGTELLMKMAQTEPKMKKIMVTGYPNTATARAVAFIPIGSIVPLMNRSATSQPM